MTQNAMILAHLRSFDHGSNKYRSLSPVEAFALYRIMSLPKRMCEIQKYGHKVIKTMKRDLTGKRYCRYALDLR